MMMAQFPAPTPEDVWTLYGDQNCPYCRKAKSLLNSIGARYKYVDAHEYGGRTEVLNIMSDMTENQRTVPLIFFKGDFVGGYNEMIKQIVGSIRSTK